MSRRYFFVGFRLKKQAKPIVVGFYRQNKESPFAREIEKEVERTKERLALLKAGFVRWLLNLLCSRTRSVFLKVFLYAAELF